MHLTLNLVPVKAKMTWKIGTIQFNFPPPVFLLSLYQTRQFLAINHKNISMYVRLYLYTILIMKVLWGIQNLIYDENKEMRKKWKRLSKSIMEKILPISLSLQFFSSFPLLWFLFSFFYFYFIFHHFASLLPFVDFFPSVRFLLHLSFCFPATFFYYFSIYLFDYFYFIYFYFFYELFSWIFVLIPFLSHLLFFLYFSLILFSINIEKKRRE